MPCLDGRERESDEHAYQAARLLCRILKEMERNGLTVGDEEIAAWWVEHQKRDAERL